MKAVTIISKAVEGGADITGYLYKANLLGLVESGHKK